MTTESTPNNYLVHFCFLLLFSPFVCVSQDYKEWTQGTIYKVDGEQFEAELQFEVSYAEGILKTREDGAVSTYSPRKVQRFVFFDSSLQVHREFYSVPTAFIKRNGHKNVFLEILYQGKEYSLFRRYIPVVKTDAAMVPLGNGLFGWAIWSNGKIESSLFLYRKDDKAYQITKGIEMSNNRYNQSMDKLVYKLDLNMIKPELGNKWSEIKKYCLKNRLDIRMESGWIEGLKYLDGSEFAYDRKKTPRRLRN